MKTAVPVCSYSGRPPICAVRRCSLHAMHRAGGAAVPGSAFGAPGYLRFSYATSEENIDAGLLAAKIAVEKARK